MGFLKNYYHAWLVYYARKKRKSILLYSSYGYRLLKKILSSTILQSVIYIKYLALTAC